MALLIKVISQCNKEFQMWRKIPSLQHRIELKWVSNGKGLMKRPINFFTEESCKI
jgi:hypothetical protein